MFWKTEDKTAILKDNNIIIDDSPKVCEDAINNDIFALYFREKNFPELHMPNKHNSWLRINCYKFVSVIPQNWIMSYIFYIFKLYDIIWKEEIIWIKKY